jgi:hypothetical protein
MIVPQFWAEARLQTRDDGRQVTVRRFGWSDASEADAYRHAEERAREAMARIRAGERLPRRERKFAYNGADGFPIREEVLARVGETVVTRNGYGAHCLNTPNVLFADIDFPQPRGTWFTCLVCLAILVGACSLAYSQFSWPGVFVAVVPTLILTGWLADRMNRKSWEKTEPLIEKVARDRIVRFVESRPGWRVRVYRTPAGFRLLAVHRLFDPLEAEVEECFRELGTDPAYARMCRNQRCFRARVTAKPWRIGIDEHIRPRPGVWPIDPERMPDRREWVERYEVTARGYAACRFVEELGTGSFHATAVAVQRFHDELSRATSELPIG